MFPGHGGLAGAVPPVDPAIQQPRSDADDGAGTRRIDTIYRSSSIAHDVE
jgi:hypothetical protein